MRFMNSAGSSVAPWRYSSAKPRMVVSGVRSSWLASATKRRMRASDSRAADSEASVAAKACWIWVSMLLSERESRSTSVSLPRTGIRWCSSPPAIAAAVASTRRSGRKLPRTTK